MKFLYDTGASILTTYMSGNSALRGPYQAPDVPGVVTVGSYALSSYTGAPRSHMVIELEVAVLNNEGRRMTAWTEARTAILDGACSRMAGRSRVDGRPLMVTGRLFSRPAKR